MEEEISSKDDLISTKVELEKSVLFEARSKIEKLEHELTLSKVQIDQSETEKQNLTAAIKELHDKFINNRLDSLIDQLNSNVLFLNEIIENMKRVGYNDNDDTLISLRSEDKEIVEDQKPIVNEPSDDNDVLTSVTKSLGRVHECIQKICEPKICNDDDRIDRDGVKCYEVIDISEDDDSDRSNLQFVSRPSTVTVIDLDESSNFSNSEDYILLSDDSNASPSLKSDLRSEARTSFSNILRKPTLEKDETPAESNTKKQRENVFYDVSQKPVSFESDNTSKVMIEGDNTFQNRPSNEATCLKTKQERSSCSKNVLQKSTSGELDKLPTAICQEVDVLQNVGANVLLCSKPNLEGSSAVDTSTESIIAEIDSLLVQLGEGRNASRDDCSNKVTDLKICPGFQQKSSTPSHASGIDHSNGDASPSTCERKTICNTLQKVTLVNYDESSSSNQSTPTANSNSFTISKTEQRRKSFFDEALSTDHSERRDSSSSSEFSDSEINYSEGPSKMQLTVQSKNSNNSASFKSSHCRKSSYDDEQNADISESDDSSNSSNVQIITVRDNFSNTSTQNKSSSDSQETYTGTSTYDSDCSSTSSDVEAISLRNKTKNPAHLKIDQQKTENFSIVLKREMIDDVQDASSQEPPAKKRAESDYRCRPADYYFLPDSKSAVLQEIRIRNRLPTWPCQFCDDCFGDPRRYSEHLNLKHVGDRRAFTCSICKFVNATIKAHRRHVNKFHGDLFLLGDRSQFVNYLKQEHAYAFERDSNK